ncbi:hypothetical protein [Nostoc sp.]
MRLATTHPTTSKTINKVGDAEQPIVDIAYDPNLSDRTIGNAVS